MVYSKENYNFLRLQRVPVQHFPEVFNFFQGGGEGGGGVQMLISVETYITCDFPGGGGGGGLTPYPQFWICACR